MTRDLMDDRRCTAKSKQSGERCKRYATPGANVCVIHGGKAPQVKARAVQRLTEQAARRTLAGLTSVDPVLDPFAALEDLAGQAVGLVDVLKNMVTDLEEIRYRGGPGTGTEQLRGELQAYLSALGRAESILGRIVSLDLDARRVRIQEAQAGAILAAFAKVLGHPSLALDAGRQRTARQLLAGELDVARSTPALGD